jgi:hypothetical protein
VTRETIFWRAFINTVRMTGLTGNACVQAA